MNKDICEWCGVENSKPDAHETMSDCIVELKRQRQSVLVRGIYYTPNMVEKLLQEKEHDEKSRD